MSWTGRGRNKLRFEKIMGNVPGTVDNEQIICKNLYNQLQRCEKSKERIEVTEK